MLSETAARLAESFRFPGSFCFVQIPAVVRTATSIASFSAALSDLGLSARTLTVTEFCDAADLATLAEDDSTVLVVCDAHVLLGLHDVGAVLDRLRPEVSRFRTSGGRLALISHTSTAAFPGSVGSPLLADAKVIYPRLETHGAITDYAQELGVSHDDIGPIAYFASGSPALAETFAIIAADGTKSGREKLRAVRAAEARIALQAMREVGSTVCSEIEYYLIECGYHEVGRSEVPDYFSALLRQAGLAKSHGDQIRLLPFINRDVWIDAALRVMQETVIAPAGWANIAEDLFFIERLLRLALYEAAATHLGAHDWRTSLVGYEAAIVNAARQDTALKIEALSDVRQPLDWLTLENLVEYAKSLALQGTDFGLSSSDCDRLKTDAAPVRNRLAHMRLPRTSDQAIVKRWRNALRLRWPDLMPQVEKDVTEFGRSS